MIIPIKFFTLAFATSVIATFNVAASSVDVSVCNDCSASQIERSAERNARGFGHNHVIVVDFVKKSAKKFSVINDENRHGEPITDTYEVAMSNDEIHDVAILHEYRKEAIRVIKVAEQKSAQKFPSSQKSSSVQSNKDDIEYVYVGEMKWKGNPYDFSRESFTRNAAYQYYFADDTKDLTKLISSTFGKIKFPNLSKMGVSIKIKFYSDSLGEVEAGSAIVSIDTTRERMEVLSAIDADNNSVPFSKYQVSGQKFQFSSEGNKNRFEGYVGSLFGSGSITGGVSGGCAVSKVVKRGNRYIYTYQCK